MAMANRSLCDTEITPDGYVVVIGDASAHTTPGIYVHQDIPSEVDRPAHALWIRTMSDHECVTAGRRVRVQVSAGSVTDGLGTPAFDGELTISSGVLAVGDVMNPDRHVLVGSPGALRVRVFVTETVDTIRFDGSDAEYPVSGPSDITVLVPDEPSFSHAVRLAPTPPWWSPQRSWSREA
ncbi:hypothetical protein QN239_02485 [Mycolicibacterium sp. Y3]